MKSLLIVFTLLVSLFSANGAFAQVPEIADSNLQDIAEVRSAHNQYGAVILYNPKICNQIGAACGFFRAHEYGHVVLKHQYLNPAAYPAVREAAADCWAATNGIPNEIYSAYQLFMAGNSSSNWKIYGNPQQRAQRVKNCAVSAGKWIGPVLSNSTDMFSSGHLMQACNCAGFNPPTTAHEKKCQSGYVTLRACPGFCPAGGNPYAYVCR